MTEETKPNAEVPEDDLSSMSTEELDQYIAKCMEALLAELKPMPQH